MLQLCPLPGIAPYFLAIAISGASIKEPLHVRVDGLVADKAAGHEVSPLAGDAEFLRRVYLDLAGRVPSAREARAFLSGGEPSRPSASERRAALIDQLLAGPDYSRRMQEVAHVMLMERRGESPEWLAFLRSSFQANKPLDRLVREILYPDVKNEATGGAAFFLTKRLEKYGENPVDYPGLTRDVGRLFLGMDLRCAQCHDHLFVDDYKQADFQGLFAVFQNTFLNQQGKIQTVGEKLMTDKLEFRSVFDKEKKVTGPRVPGQAEIAIETFPKGEEYREPPDKKANSPGVPRFSPLAKLAEQLPSADNALFARNIANRIWYIMMGRGLVHPLDLHHGDNPASHPELLDLLAGELAQRQFDVKWLLRELALTDTYQRSSCLPAGVADSPPHLFAVANEKYMSAEQLLWSILQATGPETASDKPMLPPGTSLDKLQAKFVKAFANPPGEAEGDFAPSLRAALFLLNDSSLLDCLRPQPGNLVHRLAKIQDPAQLANELYLSLLTRLPTDAERAELAELVANGASDRERVLMNAAWALLASTEFCVNH